MTSAPQPASALPADIVNNPMLSQWVRVAADGRIEVNAGKVELGQGIGTTLLVIAADELDVAPAMLRLQVGNTAMCPDQGLTAGSLSTEVGGMALRRVCAEVRQLFVEAAALRLGVDAQAIRVADGRFSAAASTADVGYHDLAALVDLDQSVRGDASPKPAAARLLAGTSLARPDLLRKLFGAGFIHDIEWPGMLHGRVLRPPSPSARLPAFDEAAQQAVRTLPGVHTVHMAGRFLAVAAQREEQALNAVEAMHKAVRWTLPELPEPSDAPAPELADQTWLRQLPSEDTAVAEINPGSGPDHGPDSGIRRIAVDYSRPFLAHASIGPSCALARWDDGRLTVCSHTQGSFALRRELAGYFGIDVDRVTVMHADGAGCYGHNGADDAAIDAAILARAAGRPVRLQWSREDEFAWSPVGSAMSIQIAAALDAQGRIVQWQHDVWSHSHVQRPGTVPEPTCLASSLSEPPAPVTAVRDFALPAGGGHRNAVPIYALPACRIAYHLTKTPVLRTSALRSLGAYANVFAIESCMDELASLAGHDPVAFRLAHLEDPRAIAVLQAAAAAAGWHHALQPAQRDGAVRGRGLGLARYKNSSAYCAVVVEIEVTDRIVLDRVWVAVDAGEVLHPDGLVNQIEGGVLQAVSWTLKEAVGWDHASGIRTRTWADYPILNFDEVPRSLSVAVLNNPDLPPLGVGECAAGPTAAAIANALANALGIRMRDLPLSPERLMAALQSDGS